MTQKISMTASDLEDLLPMCPNPRRDLSFRCLQIVKTKVRRFTPRD